MPMQMQSHTGMTLAILVVLGLAVGCGRPLKGPRFWWDDQKRERLPDDYQLPPVPTNKPPVPLPHALPEPLKDEHDKKIEKRQPRQKDAVFEEVTTQTENQKQTAPAKEEAGAGAVPAMEK